MWDTRIFESKWDGVQHTALIKGDLSKVQGNNTILLRVHSECFTGNTLGSLRCDCGQQFQQALKTIHEHHAKTGESGVVIWVGGHEGRGIGLVNKIKAYQLQETFGLDTYAANRHLGFADDLRDYQAPLLILQSLLQVQQENSSENAPMIQRTIELLTNNPHKFEATSNYFSSQFSLVSQLDSQLNSAANRLGNPSSSPLFTIKGS